MKSLYSIGVECEYRKNGQIKKEKFLLRSVKLSGFGSDIHPERTLTQNFDEAKKWFRESDAKQSYNANWNYYGSNSKLKDIAARLTAKKNPGTTVDGNVRFYIVKFNYRVANIEAEEL